jgi:hypothetical protein
LQARSREVWVDLEDIIPSARWRDEIRDAITEADAVVFVITPDSITSEVCRTEVEYATEQAKRLVPILARPTPSEGVPPALAELNWLSFLDDTNFEAGINRLVEVLDTDIDRVHLHTRLLTQAREWETHRRDHSLLLRGDELKQAETWLADQTGRKPAATPEQAQLILASRRAVTRRQRGIGATAVVVAVVMAALAAFAFIQQRVAEQQRDVAVSRLVAGEATGLRAANPALAAQLGLAAHRLAPTAEARDSLLSTFATPYATRLTGHTNFVSSVAFSSDGCTLATASADKTVRLWDVSDPRQPHPLGTLTGHTSSIIGV